MLCLQYRPRFICISRFLVDCPSHLGLDSLVSYCIVTKHSCYLLIGFLVGIGKSSTGTIFGIVVPHQWINGTKFQVRETGFDLPGAPLEVLFNEAR